MPESYRLWQNLAKIAGVSFDAIEGRSGCWQLWYTGSSDRGTGADEHFTVLKVLVDRCSLDAIDIKHYANVGDRRRANLAERFTTANWRVSVRV